MDEHAWIAAAIAVQLKDIRGTRGSLVVNLGDLFYQMASYEGDAVLIETVSNEFLPPGKRLGPGQEQRMVQLGFTQPTPDMPNWWIGMEEGLDEEIEQAAGAVAAALIEVYGIPVDTVDAALGPAAIHD